MSKIFDNKVYIFIAGFLVGAFLTFSFIATAIVFYKIGQGSANLSPAYIARKVANKLNMPQVKGKGGVSGINLSFEEGEIGWFTAHSGANIEKSKKHVTDGASSLFVRCPAGSSYAGLSWEVYKARDCLNLTNANALSFDVYNETGRNVRLYVKFKSGANYPKKSYQKEISLAPEQVTNVKIPISELKSLDVSQISYINIYLDRLDNDVTLYFDNLKTK